MPTLRDRILSPWRRFFDATPRPYVEASAPSTPPAPAPSTRLDDARADGCAPCDLTKTLGGNFYDGLDDYKSRPILPRDVIDDIYRSLLMQRIVGLLPEDVLKDPPGLLSEKVDADAVEKGAQRLNLYTHLEDALVFSRKDGGGGTLIFVEDGLDPSQPIDLSRVTRVRGFKSFTRWELIPVKYEVSTAPSWYGERFNQPSHYVVAPSAGGASAVAGLWHRSRVIPFPFIRLERRLADRGYQGWSWGVVEGIFVEFVLRQSGMVRTGDIMRGFGYDHLTSDSVQEMLGAKDGAARLKTYLDNLKACRDATGGGVAVVATGPDTKIEPLTRKVEGINKLVDAQRQFLLDVVDYPEVKLFGQTKNGLGSDEAAGERQIYDDLVAQRRKRKLWPGLKQALIVLMSAKLGPTGGVIDYDIAPEWVPLSDADPVKTAEARLTNAQARELDYTIGAVSTEEMRADDRTLRDAYPEADLEATPAPTPPDGGTGTDQGVAQTDEDPVPPDLITEAKARRRFQVGRRGLASVTKALRDKGRMWPIGGQRRYSLKELDAAIRGKNEG